MRRPGHLLTRLPRARGLRVYALGGLALLAFALLTGTHEGGSRGWNAFDNAGEAAAAVAAALACALRMRRERRLHKSLVELRREERADDDAVALQRQASFAWTLLAASLAAWAIGQIGWTVVESGFGVEPPFPSLLDVLFLSYSVLIIAGLLAMVRTPPDISRTCAARSRACSSQVGCCCAAGGSSSDRCCATATG